MNKTEFRHFRVKVVTMLAVAACLGVARAAAQQQNTTNSALKAGTANLQSQPADSPGPKPELRVKRSEESIGGKRYPISGPLVQPLKAKGGWDFSRRLVHLVNPFAPIEKKQNKPSERVSSRAWTTTVGWSPGASAFPDAINHESRMGLFKVDCPEKK